MNTIFIVTTGGGMYEDAWEHNVIACLTEADAIAYVENAELDHIQRIKDFDDYYKAETEHMKTLPEVEYIEKDIIPKWPAGISEKDITPEMRDERNKILAKNDENHEQYMVQVREQYTVVMKFRKEFFIERGYSEDDDIMTSDVVHDVEFGYGEIGIES